MTRTPAVRSRWQLSLATLLGLVTLAACVSAWFQPEQPPPPIAGQTELEQQALALASEKLATLAPDFRIPTAITPVSGNGAFVIRYWTPAHERKLLDERTVLVDLRSKSLEILPRD
jgi:hypothetical protein